MAELLGLIMPMGDGYKYYPSLDDRQDFFQAFQNNADLKGNEYVWFQSATDVSRDLGSVNSWYCSYICNGASSWVNDVGQSIMKGGWGSFQDVYNQPYPITGVEAKQWDTNRLTSEQKATQHFYDELSKTNSWSEAIIRAGGTLNAPSIDKSIFDAEYRIEHGESLLESIRGNKGIPVSAGGDEK